MARPAAHAWRAQAAVAAEVADSGVQAPLPRRRHPGRRRESAGAPMRLCGPPHPSRCGELPGMPPRRRAYRVAPERPSGAAGAADRGCDAVDHRHQNGPGERDQADLDGSDPAAGHGRDRVARASVCEAGAGSASPPEARSSSAKNPRRKHDGGSGFRQRPTLPGELPPSTIGAGRLNFRVRNGNGCGPAAITTGDLPVQIPARDAQAAHTRVRFLEAEYRYQALGRLVPVC